MPRKKTNDMPQDTPEQMLCSVLAMKATTPHQALDRLKALQLASQLLQDAGQLVWRHQVEATTAQVWELVANDLRYTLPSLIADAMPSAAIGAKVRTAARQAVESCIASWRKAGESIPETK